MTTVAWQDHRFNILVHDRDKLAGLFHDPNFQKMELAVVGVIGPPKTGKSFLLNYIMRFLRNSLDNIENWMKDGDSAKPLEGFPWNCGSNSSSETVCIWNEPLIIERDNKKIAVLLMEFGGAESLRELFQSLALRTCSLLIVNETSSILESTLSSLMDTFKIIIRDSRVPRIAFLVRDTPLNPRLNFGWKDGCAYLRQMCQRLSLPEEYEVFLKNTTCTLLPVHAFSNLQVHGSFDSLDKSFVRYFGGFIAENLAPRSISFRPAICSKDQLMNLFAVACDRANLNSQPQRISSKREDAASVFGQSASYNANQMANTCQFRRCLAKSSKTMETEDENKYPEGPAKAIVKTKVSEDEAEFGSISASGLLNKRTRVQYAASNSGFTSLSRVQVHSDPLIISSVSQTDSSDSLRPQAFFGNTVAPSASSFDSIGNEKSELFSSGKPAAIIKQEDRLAAGNRSNLRRNSNSLPGYEQAQALLDEANSKLESLSLGKQAEAAHASRASGAELLLPVSKSRAEGFLNSERIARIEGVETNIPITNQDTVAETSDNSDKAAALATSPDEVAMECDEVEGQKLTEDDHIKIFIKQTFDDCIKKFQKTLATECDLEKLKQKYFQGEKKALQSFKDSCFKRNISKSKFEEADEDLQFQFQETWMNIEKQHDEYRYKVTLDVKLHEKKHTEVVNSLLKGFFQTGSNFDLTGILNGIKSRSEAEAFSTQNFPDKFRAVFRKRVTAALETANKKAKLVHDLALEFNQKINKKLELFICLSDAEFKKHVQECKTAAEKSFNFDDPDFRRILEDFLTQISDSYEKRNAAIRLCEIQVASHILEYTKQCYNTEMTFFCEKTVHTSKAVEVFHNELSTSSSQYFKDACNFNAESGIDVEKCMSLLRAALENMKHVFLRANSLKIQKASLMIAKQNTKARTEYQRIMNGRLSGVGKSVSENQLNKWHEEAANSVLLLFKLDIQKISDNCDAEMKTLREYLTSTTFLEIKEENENMKICEVKKDAEKIEEQNRLRQFEERKRRDAESQRQEAASRNSQPQFPESRSMGSATNCAGKETVSGIGIELGHKFIRAGYMDPIKGIQIIKLDDPAVSMPFVIGVANNDLVLGSAAENCEQAINMGGLVTGMSAASRSKLIVNGQEFQLRIEELTALVLMHVKQKCEEFIGRSIFQAVITIPSWYNHELRQATKDAAQLAGFVQTRLISEAAAAGIGWWYKKRDELKLKPYRSTKLLMGVASDFSFDVAAIEVQHDAVFIRKLVGRMNISLGFGSRAYKFIKYPFSGKTNHLTPDDLTEEACSTFYCALADECVFMKTVGYEGQLENTCLRQRCTGKHIRAETLTIIGAMVLSGSGAGTGLHVEVRETPFYSLSCEDWFGRKFEICNPNSCVLVNGGCTFNATTNGWISPRERRIFKLKLNEKVDHTEKHIGNAHILPPADAKEGMAAFNLCFTISCEGILSIEAKIYQKSAQVSFYTNNLPELESSKIKLQEVLDCMGSAKACQEAIQKLMTLEHELRDHVKESTKILKLLKPAIIQEIDKTMGLISSRSTMAEIEEAIKKIEKYSAKYIKK